MLPLCENWYDCLLITIKSLDRSLKYQLLHRSRFFFCDREGRGGLFWHCVYWFLLRNLTLKPHHASSRRNKELAEMIKAQWTSYGFDVKLVRYNVLLSFPVEGKINGVALLDGNGSVMFRSANREEVLEPMEQSSDVLRPFSAFSPTGKAKVSRVWHVCNLCSQFYYLQCGVTCNLNKELSILDRLCTDYHNSTNIWKEFVSFSFNRVTWFM